MLVTDNTALDDRDMHCRQVTTYHVQSFLSIPVADPGRAIGAISSLKPTKVTLFTMILYNSENNIRDTRPFCRLLFCQSSVVNYTSSLLQ